MDPSTNTGKAADAPVMGEIVDELLTPGCLNCYIKHLSAALASFADDRIVNMAVPGPAIVMPDCLQDYEVLVARAVINLTEYLEGYRSHADFAVGLLVRAEIRSGSSQSMCKEIRGARLALTNALDAAADQEARDRRVSGWMLDFMMKDPLLLWRTKTASHDLNNIPWALAHLAEAAREYRGEWLDGELSRTGLIEYKDFPKAIIAEIARVRGNNLPKED